MAEVGFPDLLAIGGTAHVGLVDSTGRRIPAVRSAFPALVVLALVACGGPRERTTPPPAPPGVLHAPSEYAGDFALDQRVTIGFTRPDGSQDEQGFRAVIEKRGDGIVMVALGPHGGRAFVLTQRGTDVRFESHLPEELPFPPEYMMFDVHRTWLVGVPGAPLADGEHSAAVDGEEIVETWSGGRLQSRSFRRLDGVPAGLVTITYEGGLDPSLDAAAPTRVVMENGWFGYRIVLDELTRRALPPPDAAPATDAGAS
jgi:hypothetical protein